MINTKANPQQKSNNLARKMKQSRLHCNMDFTSTPCNTSRNQLLIDQPCLPKTNQYKYRTPCLQCSTTTKATTVTKRKYTAKDQSNIRHKPPTLGQKLNSNFIHKQIRNQSPKQYPKTQYVRDIVGVPYEGLTGHQSNIRTNLRVKKWTTTLLVTITSN